MPRGREALVEAICPPDIAALGVAPAVVDDVQRMLVAAAPAPRVVLRATLSALAAGLPVPSSLAEAARALLLTVAYEQPEVYRLLGYDPAAWIAVTAAQRTQRWAADIRAHADALARPEPLVPGASSDLRPGRFTSGRDMAAEVTCDAVVVGSGAGGAVVAAELAEAGWDVVVLEEGSHRRTEQFTADALSAFRTLYRDGGLTTMLGKPPVTFAEGRCVGGSTTVNGGMAWRTPDAVLDRWQDECGLDPATLTPLFDRVERRLSVGPQDPQSIGRDQLLLRMGAEKLGWAVVGNQRAQVHCQGCNACVLGCPTGAKQSTLVSYLPRAVAFGAQVVADCRVERILFVRKKAIGVRAVDHDGRRIVVRAPVVVVASGALQTPVLLAHSGFRSPSGQLGRNLAIHPGANVAALFDEPVRAWEGVHQAYQVREFDGVLMAAVNVPPGLVAGALRLDRQRLGQVMARYDRMVTAGVLVDDTTTGRVRSVGGRPLVRYDLAARDAQRIVTAVADLCRLLLAAGAHQVHLPFAGIPPVACDDDVTAWREQQIASSRIAVTTVHLMGTARMGIDPSAAVCDLGGRVYDTSGLYVADASLLPGPVGLNPQETIMTLATLVAQSLITGRRP